MLVKENSKFQSQGSKKTFKLFAIEKHFMSECKLTNEKYNHAKRK